MIGYVSDVGQFVAPSCHLHGWAVADFQIKLVWKENLGSRGLIDSLGDRLLAFTSARLIVYDSKS